MMCFTIFLPNMGMVMNHCQRQHVVPSWALAGKGPIRQREKPWIQAWCLLQLARKSAFPKGKVRFSNAFFRGLSRIAVSSFCFFLGEALPILNGYDDQNTKRIRLRRKHIVWHTSHIFPQVLNFTVAKHKTGFLNHIHWGKATSWTKL